MRYWILKLLGRADGDTVARCPMCRKYFNRQVGVQSQEMGLVCSNECANDAFSHFAW